MDSIGQKLFEGANERWKRVFIFTLTFILTYFILMTAVTPTRYHLVAGDIANVDIKAPRDIIDEEATAEKEKEIIATVEKVYSLKGEVKANAKKNVTNFFNKLTNLKSDNIDEKEKITQLRKIDDFNLIDSQYKTLLALNVEKYNELQWELLKAIEKAYEYNIGEDKLTSSVDDNSAKSTTVEQAKQVAHEILNQTKLEQNLIAILSEMAYSQIEPNFVIDKEKTDEKLTEALKTTPKVMIKKNQIIVKEGEPITDKQIAILTELGLIGNGIDKANIILYMMLAIYVALILSTQYFYLKKERINILLNTKLVFMIVSLNVVLLFTARGMSIISPFIIPLACTAMVMTVLLDYKVSMVVNLLNIMLIAVIVGFSPKIILLGILNVIAGTTLIRKAKGRNDVLYVTTYLLIASALMSLATGMLISNNLKMVFSDVALSIFGALLSGILAIGVLPFLEIAFNIVTNMKLIEFANPNSPLLKRLLMEAPGTYHHSIMVANLAEVAAEEIEANPVLARTGAYYHDVGKLKRPIFFAENQMGKENPHTRIKARLSANVIISHATDGLDLAKEYKLPIVIQDIIMEHHGTTLFKYFYYKEKNSKEDGEEVKEEDFKYSGPTPSSKESAIIMLADSVEAAVRSIQIPTKEKIEEMVNSIFKDKLQADQLQNCELTLKDLETIKKCFLKVLHGVYHQRIEYPTEKIKS